MHYHRDRHVANDNVNAISAHKANKKNPTNEQVKQQLCIKCGANGHHRRFCEAKNVHCDFCNVNSNNTAICFKKKKADEGKSKTADGSTKTPSIARTNMLQVREE